jgi:hypothetical protein
MKIAIDDKAFIKHLFQLLPEVNRKHETPFRIYFTLEFSYEACHYWIWFELRQK